MRGSRARIVNLDTFLMNAKVVTYSVRLLIQEIYRDFFALRLCWVKPPIFEAHADMAMSRR